MKLANEFTKNKENNYMPRTVKRLKKSFFLNPIEIDTVEE